MFKNRLFLSLLFSSFCHALILFTLQTNSFWVGASSKDKAPPHEEWISSMPKGSKEEILRAVFEKFQAPPDEKAALFPKKEGVAAPFFLHHLPDIALERIGSLPPLKSPPSPFLEAKLLVIDSAVFFPLPEEKKVALSHLLPKDLPFSSAKAAENMPPIQNPSKVPLVPLTTLSFSLPQSQEPILPPSLLFSSESKEILPLLDQAVDLSAKAPLAPLLNGSSFPTLEELKTASYSASFDSELSYIYREEEGDYLFALTLIPKEDLQLPQIRQNYTFLIDRSNSMLEERLQAAKSAVLRALAELGSDDTFNIIAFDSKIEKFSPLPQKVNKRTLAQAKEFLKKIELGSFFSSGDLYKPLLLTIPAVVEEDELFTVVLLSDGEHLTKKHAQHTLIRDWTAYNQGKVALFGVGIGGDLHLRNLEAAAAFNRGKLVYCPTKRGIKRKMVKLMKSIQVPIAKNISCKTVSSSPGSKIELFSKISQSPHLYLNEPYVLIGKASSLDDFILFVQGKLANRWLNIKKRISFSEAKEGGESLKLEWALQKAFRLYENYILEEDSNSLTEAKELLKPFNLQVDFK